MVEITKFFSSLTGLTPHFSNPEFAEFVLPSKGRIAFFSPVGKAALFFGVGGTRDSAAFGLTVESVETTYQNALALGVQVSGPPKDHPWGERSFLLIDPDGNRWEITQSPTADGFLAPR